jgi:hypothetical protein
MRTFKIDGEPVIVSPSWSISDTINSRTTAQLDVEDLLNLAEINIGDEIEITDDSVVIFKGTVETVEQMEDDPGFLKFAITAVDFNALADKRIIASSYTNEVAGDIVKSFITDVLNEEGITEGTIADGPIIKKAIFNYDKATTALDYIKDITGLNWNIDFDKKLNLFERSNDISPIVLNDTIQHVDFKRTKTRSQYRNRQYIRAGRGRTNQQSLEKPSPGPDGVSKNFTLRFPIATKPRIFIDSVEVDPSEIGVNGSDTNKKFYFSIGSNVISQDDDETTLTTEVLEVTYVGLFPILTVAESPGEIIDRATKETGTSGIYEDLKKETAIDESSAALEFAQGLLQKYGIIPSIVTFRTQVAGFKAGQLLTIEKTLYDISDSFLIESIYISTDGINTIYDIKCLDGSALGGWEEFFKELIKGDREFIIQENEVLILLVTSFEAQSWTEITTPTVNTCPIPSEDLFPTDELVPC